MSSHDEGIILEMTQVGHSMEVRAIAPDGLEVAFIAPVDAPQHELHALARNKLAYVRRKADHGDAGPGNPGRGGRGGILA